MLTTRDVRTKRRIACIGMSLILAAICASTLLRALRLRALAARSAPVSREQGAMFLRRLREEPIIIETERKLQSHAYVAAAEAGTLTLAQRRAFACEQYSVQKSDARSFAALAGHEGFLPTSLVGAMLPQSVMSGHNGRPNLFQYLMEGELYAAPLLMSMAAALGFAGEHELAAYPTTARAQGYPSYWARLALSQQRAQGAAACAINFAAWGRMCARVSAALASGKYGVVSSSELAFLDYFAEPIEGLDEMAIDVIVDEGSEYDELLTAVRLMQEYELLFWDAIFAAKDVTVSL